MRKQALPDREEYLDSEKYQFKERDWDWPGNIKDDIRSDQPLAPRQPGDAGISEPAVSPIAEPDILAYAKLSADQADAVVVVVNLDPHMAHQGEVELPLAALGLETDDVIYPGGGVQRRRIGVLAARGNSSASTPQTNPALIFRLQRPASA